jgi:hypothetical protein
MCVAPIPAFADSQIAAMVLTRWARPVPRLGIPITSVISYVVNARRPTPPMCVAPVPIFADGSMIAAINVVCSVTFTFDYPSPYTMIYM